MLHYFHVCAQLNAFYFSRPVKANIYVSMVVKLCKVAVRKKNDWLFDCGQSVDPLGIRFGNRFKVKLNKSICKSSHNDRSKYIQHLSQ